MSPERNELGRRQFVQAAGTGIAGAACLSAGVGTSTAQQAGEAPAEDEYEDILAEMDGDGTEGNPYSITDVVELQAVSGDIEGRYQLGTDIDASVTAEWNDGAGFDPILAPESSSDGESASRGQETDRLFGGLLSGNGHEISGLTIDRPDADTVGLFAVNNGAVVDLTITDATVTGNTAGILAASNAGGVGEVTVEGSVTGTEVVGGIAGVNQGLFANSEADVDVTGTRRVGGLAGVNNSEISNVTVAGSVDGENSVGGVAGQNSEVIANVDSNATVSGTTVVGGVAGDNPGRVSGSLATGEITGDKQVGGIAGESRNEVLGSLSSSTVTGQESVGGVVGKNHGVVRVSASHGDVRGSTNVGGILGWGSAGTIVTDVYAVGQVTGDSAVGALIGRFGWEFLNDDQSVKFQRGYWSSEGTDHGPVGLVETGEGTATVNEETLAALERSQFVGEDVPSRMPEFDFEQQWRAFADDMPLPRARTPSVFEIQETSVTELTVRKDESFDIELDIENTGDWEGTQSIVLLIDGDPFESVDQQLDSGEATQVAMTDLTPTEIPVGTYTFTIQTRNDQVEGTIKIENALPGGNDDTPGDETPGDDTPGDDTAGTGTESTPGGADGDGPGFGVGGAVIGIGTGIALLRRRVSRDE